MKSNKIFKTMVAVSLLISGSFITACSKEEDIPQQAPKTIFEIVNTSTNFTLLKAAIQRADLQATLSGAGTFTVFAPTDDAFKAAGYNTAADINNVAVATLKDILLYHVLSTKVNAADVPAGPNAAVNTVANKNIFATRNTNGVFINGNKVATADIAASNGVIHVIGSVLIPPSGNIVQTAVANPNFTYLVAAITRASEGSTNVAQVLSGNGPFTVFAPTNQAFIDAGFPTIASIQAASPAALTPILTYHVIASRVFSSDLSEGLKPATVNGGTLTISLSSGAKVKGNGNATSSNITGVNIVTTNGVIHVIDRVLLP